MDWKVILDKYLTSNGDDGFDNWCEIVLGDKISDTFYNENEDWIDEYSGQCNKWLNKLYTRSKKPTLSAIIIERAYKLYIKRK
jgi:hypothetical protein